jgi:hypothetical protein
MSRFALVAALLMAAPAYAEGGYFNAIDDLPLPPGFTERAGPPVSFAGPSGRLVLAEAQGSASGLAVRAFYYEALPQLGWAVSPQPDGALVFQRGRERLSFTVESANGRTQLSARLVVSPAATAAD